MTDKTEYPVLHADQHLPDGSDPIPGLFQSGGQLTYPDAVLANPAIWAYWPLDDTSGNPHEVIAGRDLTVHGGGISYGAAGPFLNMPELTAVTLDGSNDWMSYTLTPGEQDEFLTTVALPWSWVGWFYLTGTFPDSLVTLHNMVAGGGAFAQTVYTFTSVHLHLTRTTDVDSGDAMPSSNFHMVACTYAGSATGAMKLYLDGVLIGTLTSTTPDGFAKVMVGAQGNLGAETNFWQGRISQLAMFTAELGGDEITELAGLDSASGDAEEGWVFTADGAGGTSWAAPTITVDF